MSQVRGMFYQLMAPGLKKIYKDWQDMEQRAEEYPTVFNVKGSDAMYEQELEMAGVGPLQEKPENTPTQYTAMIQGGSYRFLHLTYSLGIRTSKELMDDDQYGLIRQGPRTLARSSRFTREVIAWSIFNQGFSSNVVTFDGNPLFYNQHALLGGSQATAIAPGLGNIITAAGTYPNRPETDIDLSIAGLQLAINQANRMVDNRGFPTASRWKHLLIPPELIFIAREILGSPGKPYTSDNEINSILPENLDVMQCHYFTSASSWFLTADKMDTALTFYNRERETTTFDNDFDTDAIKQKVRFRVSAGCPQWQGTWGSMGP
ncbi:MAG TPA: Mu-like prophage major head subunit gpT family protein [Candidatus Saccharimonadales bacterium]|jgi:hypothetical protein